MGAAASAALAGPGIFGTKVSPVSTTTSDTGMGAMPVAQMFVALLVVLALLKWLMPALLKKFSGKSGISSNGIRVQETASVGPANLYVVEVRGKSLLIGATTSSVSCIADLTTTDEPLPTFQELVDSAPAKNFGDSSLSDALSQLQRLRNFGS